MPIFSKERVCILSLIILGLLFFYKTIYFGFLNIDDPLYVTENSYVLNFDLWSLLFKPTEGLYNQLTSLSFAFDWWLGGGKPWIFHLNNFIFHIFATLVLFKVCLNLWPNRLLLGFLIAFAFMLHPLKVESVAWITERKDVLSGLFLWLTLYLYLTYLERFKLRHYIFANLAFLFALAGKVSVVPLPIFLFILDWYKGQKLRPVSLINKFPFFGLSAAFGLFNVFEQSHLRSVLRLPEKNYADLIYQMHFYLEKFLFPWNLRAWYSPESLNFNAIGSVSVALTCVLTILILAKYRAQRRDLILGFSFFALFLFPNIKVLPPGDANLVNDRYMYIALTGLTFAFFPFILQSIEYWWKKQRTVFALTLSILFAAFLLQWFALGHLQVGYWRDSVTLWERASKFESNSERVARFLGRVLLSVKRTEEALPYLQSVVSEVGDYEHLGDALLRLGRNEEAQSVILRGLEIYPDHFILLHFLGRIKSNQKEHQEALRLFTLALKNLKDEPPPRVPTLRAIMLNNIGLTNMHLGDSKEAESLFRRSLEFNNLDGRTIYHLGASLLKQNRLEEAKDAFLQTLKLNPDLADAYNNVGFIFYQEKNFVQARSWFNRALEVDPNLEIAKNNLMAMDREKH